MIKIEIVDGCKLLVLKSVMFSLFLAFVFLQASSALAADSKAPCKQEDPMVKITSLPIKQDVKEVLARISEDVSREVGIDKNFVTYYWQTFDEIYCPGCEVNNLRKPIFVDLYVPGFMTEDEIKNVMISLAAALERHTDYNRKEVFIHTHIASKKQLYIMGDVVTDWRQVGGPAEAEVTDQGKEKGPRLPAQTQGPALK